MFDSSRKDTVIAIQTTVDSVAVTTAVVVETLIDSVVEDTGTDDMGFPTTAGQTREAVGTIDAVATGIG